MRKELLWLFLSSTLSAQDWQNRNVVHVQADISQKWFVAGWSITNLRTGTPNNTNLFGGLGYRGKAWWLEGMVQRQWSSKGNQVMLDFRFDKQAGRYHFYAEGSPFLTKKAFYEFVIVERRTWKGFALGAETENVHQDNRDTVQVGPRASRKLGRFAGFDVSMAAAVRLSPVGGRTEPRLYVIFNRRITKESRKH